MSKKKKKSDLEVLRNLGAIAEELKNSPASTEFWIELDKEMDKLHEEQERFNKSIQMSYEKFHQPFTI